MMILFHFSAILFGDIWKCVGIITGA